MPARRCLYVATLLAICATGLLTLSGDRRDTPAIPGHVLARAGGGDA